MTEPDVTLTDYALAVLCLGFAWILRNQTTSARRHQALWTIFFASIAAASLAGGTVHGFFAAEHTAGYRVLWPLTLIFIGVTTAMGWILAGLLYSGMRGLRVWAVFAALMLSAYTGVVLFYSQEFSVAIFAYLPAMVALWIAALRAYVRTRAGYSLWLAAGIVLGFVAALLQYAGIALHREYFDHNSTYHVVKALGLWMLFVGARRQLISIQEA